MIKSLIANILIIPTIFLLLGHAIIPHHHIIGHPSSIGFHYHQDDDHEDADDSRNEPENHKHSGEKGYLKCLLCQIILTKTNTSQNHFHDLVNVLKSTNNLFISTVNVFDLANISVPNLTLNPPPLLKSSYTEFTNQSFGLRAPPLS